MSIVHIGGAGCPVAQGVARKFISYGQWPLLVTGKLRGHTKVWEFAALAIRN